jgi:hypothetical protein
MKDTIDRILSILIKYLSVKECFYTWKKLEMRKDKNYANQDELRLLKIRE